MAYKPSKSPILKYSKKLGGSSFGLWLLSKVIAFSAPYFRSIRPKFTKLEPGHVEVFFKKRWGVQNHLKTIHAIAMCNAAELAGGTCLEVSLHGDMRWIPVGMEVQYLKMAKTHLRAVCKVEDYKWETPQDVIMPVEVFDLNDQKVFHADIKMRISERKKRKA